MDAQTSVVAALKYLYSREKDDLFFNSQLLKACLNDYAHDYPKERRQIMMAMEAGLGERLAKAMHAQIMDKRALYYNLCSWLEEETGLAKISCQQILSAFFEVLEWQTSEEEPVPAPPKDEKGIQFLIPLAMVLVIAVACVFIFPNDKGTPKKKAESIASMVTSVQPVIPSVSSTPPSAEQQMASTDVHLGVEPTAYNIDSSAPSAYYSAPLYPQTGDTVTFGSYEQDSNRNNGAEDVEWIVLESDPQNGRLLLISKYVLDKQRYNGKYTHVNWVKCDIRSWLNESFYSKCFSRREKQAILTRTMYSPYGEKVVETADPVFCLSAEETRDYFSSRGDRKAKATDFARDNKVAMSGSYCYWWLRGSSERTNDADRVEPDGSIQTYGGNTNADGVGVRPAIWVDISYFVNK